MKKKSIVAIVALLCLVLLLAGIVCWFIFDNNKPDNFFADSAEQGDDFGTEYTGVINYDGSTAENLKCGGLATIQEDWVYYGQTTLVKENIHTGEKIEILAGQSTVSNIAVCGEYLYFILDSSEIYRMKTDGSDLESIYVYVGNGLLSFFFEDEYIYFKKGTQTGSSSYRYSISRISVNDIYNTETVYELGKSEEFVGVYEGYAVIIEETGSYSFVLCDVNTKESKTVTTDENVMFYQEDCFHFDQGNIIYTVENIVLVYNIESDSFTEKKYKPSNMYIEYVCDGKYYFYMVGFYSYEPVHGYIQVEWMDGENTRYVELGEESLDRVNVVNNKIYYLDRLGGVMLSRTDMDGSNWEQVQF